MAKPSEFADLGHVIEQQKSPKSSATIDAQLEEILTDALSIIRQELGMTIGFIAQFSGGRRVIKVSDTSENKPVLKVGDSDLLENTYCQRVVDGRFPNLINDALTFPDARELQITAELSIRAYASAPVCFSDGEVYGTFCCFSTEEGKDFEEKDLAMLSVFAQFTGRQIEKVQRRHAASNRLSHQVRSIIDNGLICPVYQPICDIRENQIIGYEALSRVDVEPYEPPNIWFSAAQAVGLQTEMEISAITSALSNLDQIPEDCYVSVNVSPETLSHPSFLDHLSRFPLDSVLVEVTEHADVDDYQLFNDQLKELRARGVQLAIDDVGAGYSSLRHILELKPEIIKLDRSLITEIDKRFDLRSMAQALIGFATDMSINIIAEGIETEEELRLLDELGVIKAQGYFLGKPASIDQLQRN